MEGSHEVIEGCYNPDMTRCAQEENAYVEMGESRLERMDNFFHGKQMWLKSNAKKVGENWWQRELYTHTYSRL